MKPTLAQHLSECELRYQSLEQRLKNVEHKVDQIIEQIDDFKMFFVRLAVKSGIGLIAMIAGAVFVIRI